MVQTLGFSRVKLIHKFPKYFFQKYLLLHLQLTLHYIPLWRDISFNVVLQSCLCQTQLPPLWFTKDYNIFQTFRKILFFPIGEIIYKLDTKSFALRANLFKCVPSSASRLRREEFLTSRAFTIENTLKILK